MSSNQSAHNPQRPSGSLKSIKPSNELLESIDLYTLASELLSRSHAFKSSLHAGQKILGELGAEIDLQFYPVQANRYSIGNSMSLLQTLMNHPDFNLSFLRDSTCVDVGCGGLSPFGPLFVLLLAGAKRGIGIDLDTIKSTQLATRALYTCLSAALTKTSQPKIPGSANEILQRIQSFDLEKIAIGDSTGINKSRLEFRNVSFLDSGIETASADIVSSNAFLEHVLEPDEIIQEMARISRPGGLGVHLIDGRDHRWYSEPRRFQFDFLRDESKKPILYGCNRIRPLQFIDIFQKSGFEIRHIWKAPAVHINDEVRASFAEPYRSMPLNILEVPLIRLFVRRH